MTIMKRTTVFLSSSTAFALLIFVSVISGCSKKPTSMATADKSVQAAGCAMQLKQFANAKQLWAQQNNKSANDTPTMDDIAPFIRCNTNCPGGGTYTLGKVGDLPTCSIPEHEAAFQKAMQDAQQPPAASQ